MKSKVSDSLASKKPWQLSRQEWKALRVETAIFDDMKKLLDKGEARIGRNYRYPAKGDYSDMPKDIAKRFKALEQNADRVQKIKDRIFSNMLSAVPHGDKMKVRMAYANAGGDRDSWRKFRQGAIEFAHITLGKPRKLLAIAEQCIPPVHVKKHKRSGYRVGAYTRSCPTISKTR